MYNYNYIVFYNNDDSLPKPVPDGYQTLSLMDLDGVEDVHVVPYPLHHLPYSLRFTYFACKSKKLNKIIPLFIKRLFYPFFFDKRFLDKKPICFLLIGGGKLPADYLRYLKKKYPKCKIVGFYRDLVRVCEQLSPETIHNKNVDIEMSFDIGEAKKYGMAFCPEYSSLVDLSDHDKYPSCDVFFCGKAKDRYEKLIDYYKFLTNKGLKCDFFIAEVPEKNQILGEGLFYNYFMPYKEMLCRSINAKCLLDINQEDAFGGYTSRFYEAIMYNRKLISDNPITKDSSFYNPKDIIFVTKPEDITEEYIKNIGSSIDYHYNGEFSPLRMIETVEKLLQE
jgi:hypothetical protein